MKRPFHRKRLQRWLKGDLDRTALLGIGEQDRDELLFEAGRLFNRGDVEAANKVFWLAQTLFPHDPASRIGIAACAQAVGKLSLAMGLYEQILDESPLDPFASAGLAECALIVGDAGAAKAALGRVTPAIRLKLSKELAARIAKLEQIAEARALAEPPDPCPDRADESTDAEIVFAVEESLSITEFLSILNRSGLAERRPMDEEGTIFGMLNHCTVIVTARSGRLLVGISRAITDFHFCTYLSDLAVDRDHQKRGIGRELIHRTHEAAGLKTTLILLAAPAAREYYPHIGMTAHGSCWIIPRTPPIEGKSQ